eukprot:Hpha_TRINITY_DN16614_c1_g1::TRINITY_DN16614_c1_g1_i27::g.180759::m.180759
MRTRMQWRVGCCAWVPSQQPNTLEVGGRKVVTVEDYIDAFSAASETVELRCAMPRTSLMTDNLHSSFDHLSPAPINTDGGRTECHACTARGYAEGLRLLIAAGADVNGADSAGRTPLFMAASVDVVRVLIGAGAGLTVTDNKGMTPYHYAAMKGNVDVLRVLVSEGGGVNTA